MVVEPVEVRPGVVLNLRKLCGKRRKAVAFRSSRAGCNSASVKARSPQPSQVKLSRGPSGSPAMTWKTQPSNGRLLHLVDVPPQEGGIGFVPAELDQDLARRPRRPRAVGTPGFAREQKEQCPCDQPGEGPSGQGGVSFAR